MSDIKEEATFGWRFDNSYARLPKLFFTRVNPTPVEAPSMIIFNDAYAKQLGLDVQPFYEESGVATLSGNQLPQGAEPIAQAYAGHQFGHFNMLGDGRAILLGEHITPANERVDIQWKGPGRTPYSRGGDGRAAIGPMLREYIMSEAMHALGIPTTRSLAVVSTGQPVFRETELPGAVLTRTAASHLRVGTFQYAANWGTFEELQTLADYAIERHFPDIADDKDRYLLFLQKMMERQASLIAKWQLVGFIHGVMNTDNMAISGETIDYGPCAFMDIYHPGTVFSSIDTQGRYAYGNQPNIGGWNIARFAEALLPLLHENPDEAVRIAQEMLQQYPKLYYTQWLSGMRAKLGIFNEEVADAELVEQLLKLMQEHQADYTNAFVALTFDQQTTMHSHPDFQQWYEQWQTRLSRQANSKDAVHQLMRNSNPAIIPRNHRVEEALDAAVKRGDYLVMKQLLEVLANPFAHSAEQQAYASLPEPSNRPYRTFCGT